MRASAPGALGGVCGGEAATHETLRAPRSFSAVLHSRVSSTLPPRVPPLCWLSLHRPRAPPQVKAAVAAKLGACEALEVQRYRTQVVAGTNFKVHAKVDGKDVIITAFRPLPHTGEALSVSDVVEGSDL